MEFLDFGWDKQLGSSPLGFVPSDLTGLKLWTRFNSGITVTGAGVSQWDDVSGQGNHIKQAVDANRPIPGSLGSELVTNGDFTTDTDWTKGTGWTITGGVCRSTAAGSGASAFQDAGITAQTTYLVTFTVSGYSAGGIWIRLGDNDGTTIRSANGTYTEIVTTTTVVNANAYVKASGATTTLDVDNLSIKAIDSTQGVLFDGLAHFLKADAFTLVQPETVYILFKQVTWTSGETFFDGNTAASGIVRQSATGLSPDIRSYAGLFLTNNSDLILDAYAALSTIFNGASSVLQVNNGTPTTGNSGANNMGGFTLGAQADPSSFSNIQVKEVAVFDSAHDAAQRAQMINYLLSI